MKHKRYNKDMSKLQHGKQRLIKEIQRIERPLWLRVLYHKYTKRAVDGMAYFVAIIGNVAVIPQIIKAWQNNAPGLAVETWLLFAAGATVWLFYAIHHKQKPLLIAQILSIFCNLAVVAGWAFHNFLF